MVDQSWSGNGTLVTVAEEAGRVTSSQEELCLCPGSRCNPAPTRQLSAEPH